MPPGVAPLEEVVCPQVYWDRRVVGLGGFLVPILQERGGLGVLARLGALSELELRGSQVGGSLLLVSEKGETSSLDWDVSDFVADAAPLGASVGRFRLSAGRFRF